MASVRAEPPRDWTPGRTALATLVVAAVAAAFAALFYLQAAVFCLLVAIILATALRRPVVWLERRGVPRVAAVVIVFVLLGILLATVLAIGIPLLARQVLDLRDALPGFYEHARNRLLNSSSGLIRHFAAQLAPTLPWLGTGRAGPPAAAEFVPPALGYLGAVLPSMLMFLAVLMLAFYWCMQEDRTVRALLLLVPVQRRDAARELVELIQAKIGGFVFGQATVCLIIGMLTFIAYTVIGLPHALPLAILSGLLESVPVFGLLASALPAALVALSISGGKLFALVVAIAAIHLTDNFLISPKILGRSVGLHPIVTLLALVGFGALFGLPGAVLAILLASIVKLLLDRFMLSREAQAVSFIAGRDHISLLRREVREVLQDVRLNLRKKEQASTPTNDRLEEAIENIAADVERMLSAEIAERNGTHDEIEVAR